MSSRDEFDSIGSSTNPQYGHAEERRHEIWLKPIQRLLHVVNSFQYLLHEIPSLDSREYQARARCLQQIVNILDLVQHLLYFPIAASGMTGFSKTAASVDDTEPVALWSDVLEADKFECEPAKSSNRISRMAALRLDSMKSRAATSESYED